MSPDFLVFAGKLGMEKEFDWTSIKILNPIKSSYFWAGVYSARV